MNRWTSYAIGLVIVLLTGVSVSNAQVESMEEAEVRVVEEGAEEGV